MGAENRHGAQTRINKLAPTNQQARHCHGIPMAIAIACTMYCHGFAMALPWHCHGNEMALSWQRHSIVLALPWQFQPTATER